MILKRVWDVRMLIGGVVDVFSVVATTFDEACKEAKKAIDENFVKKDGFIESIDWAGKTVLVEESSPVKLIKVSHMINGESERKMYNSNEHYESNVKFSIINDMMYGILHDGLVKFVEMDRENGKIVIGELLVFDRTKTEKEPVSQGEIHLNNDKMSVFRCFRQGEYAGGVILVAAHSLKEAFDTFINDPNVSYLTYFNDDGGFSSDAYPISEWEIIPNLYFNASHPCVILENSHAE